MNKQLPSLWSGDNRNLIIITTAKGLVPVLSEELARAGLKATGATETGVSLFGSMADAMRLNFVLRTAHRVLWKIGEGSARTPTELHKAVTGWPWERWVPGRGYVCVTASGQTVGGDDPRFVALKTKDAIMDRMNGVNGYRPDSGPDRGKTVVHVHWEGRFFTVYLDTSGESLSHRGYRLQPFKAPMRETLAAGCLLASEWPPGSTLINPMCGSGTLAIEAAMMASRTPAGYNRTNFGFMHLVGYDDRAWKALREELSRDRLVRPLAVKILASDIDPAAIEAAKTNASRAGMSAWIAFETCDFTKARLAPPPGMIMFNPEYGERLGENSDLSAQYKAIGDFMKNKAQGFTGAVFTGNAEMIKAVGLKPRSRYQMFNGPIECRLLVYDLYGGTKRDRRLRPNAPNRES